MIRTIVITNPKEVEIRAPKKIGKVSATRKKRSVSNNKKRRHIFDYLLGVLADDPLFKGKTSVEVQHMTMELWAKKYS